jgi:hypothetical protein
MIDEHENLIGLIYDGITDDDQWSLMLAKIAALANSAGVGLGLQDMRTHEFRSLGAHGIDVGLHHTYRRLAPGNRVWREIGRRRRPMTDRMVMPKAAFERTELFADWFKPQSFHGVMAHPTLFKDSASSVLVAFRSPSQGTLKLPISQRSAASPATSAAPSPFGWNSSAWRKSFSWSTTCSTIFRAPYSWSTEASGCATPTLRARCCLRPARG